MRLKGDLTVNAAINNSIMRESEWTHKKSTVVTSETIYNYVVSQNCPQNEMLPMPENIGSEERAKVTHIMKTAVKKKVFFRHS